jgi:hypothetical protein
VGGNKTTEDIEECVLKFFMEVLCWNSCFTQRKREEEKIEETADLSTDFLFRNYICLGPRLWTFVLSQESTEQNYQQNFVLFTL